jgi:hypothetical protein
VARVARRDGGDDGLMSKIFLSYRRQDTAGIAGRIYDRLRARFGSDAVFMDIDTIPFGVDFREHIDAAVGQCDVALAVIGPRWSGQNKTSRRIDDAKDFVRIEIESALQRGIPVISRPKTATAVALLDAIEADPMRPAAATGSIPP